MSFRFAGMAFGVAACVVTASATCAAADPTANRVSLRWAAPDECPDDVRLVHQVEALLGQTLPDAGDQPPTLQARVSVQGNPEHGYAAKLSFDSARGDEDRYLEHPSCDQLLRAVALVVALAIDPERVRAVQERAAGAEPTPPSAPPAAEPPAPPPSNVDNVRVPTPRSEAQQAHAERARDPLRGTRLAWHGVAGAGALPGFNVGFEAELGWHRETFRAELLGRYWLPQQTAISGTPASVELGLATIGARGCWLPLRGSWQLAGCAGASVGDLRGVGIGVENGHTRHARYSEAAVGAQLAYARSRLEPEVGVQLAAALERPRFGITENGQEKDPFQPAVLAFSAFVGLALEL